VLNEKKISKFRDFYEMLSRGYEKTYPLAGYAINPGHELGFLFSGIKVPGPGQKKESGKPD